MSKLKPLTKSTHESYLGIEDPKTAMEAELKVLSFNNIGYSDAQLILDSGFGKGKALIQIDYYDSSDTQYCWMLHNLTLSDAIEIASILLLLEKVTPAQLRALQFDQTT